MLGNAYAAYPSALKLSQRRISTIYAPKDTQGGSLNRLLQEAHSPRNGLGGRKRGDATERRLPQDLPTVCPHPPRRTGVARIAGADVRKPQLTAGGVRVDIFPGKVFLI